jgi:hypothetical protein
MPEVVDPDPVIDDYELGLGDEIEDITWRDSKPITELANYLSTDPDKGVSLVSLEGRPTLHFNPPLDNTDQDRISFVHCAFDLLLAALDDIDLFLSAGVRIMPDHPGY